MVFLWKKRGVVLRVLAVGFLKAQCCQWGSKNRIVFLIVVCVLGTAGWSWSEKVLLSLLGHCYQKGQLKPGSAGKKTAAHAHTPCSPASSTVKWRQWYPACGMAITVRNLEWEKPCNYWVTRNTSKQDASWAGLCVYLTPPLKLSLLKVW